MAEVEIELLAEEQESQRKKRGRKPKAREPQVGQIVGYVATTTIRPAIIAGVGEALDLVVFNKADGAIFVEGVEFDASASELGTWHWLGE